MRTRSRFFMAVPTVALVAGLGAAAAAQANGQSKSDVCHLRGDGSYELITVADPALDAHFAHGDGAIGGDVPGLDAKVFDAECSIVDAPVAGVVVARAYVDADGDQSYSEGDVLIAEAVEDTVDGSYTVNTDRYPQVPSATAITDLGNFLIKERTLPAAALSRDTAEELWLSDPATGDFYSWQTIGGTVEQYTEVRGGGAGSTTLIDRQRPGDADSLWVTVTSPSNPDMNIPRTSAGSDSLGDDLFLQVEITPIP